MKPADEMVTVTLRVGQWASIAAAAASYGSRIPLAQGDGGECLRAIREAIGVTEADHAIQWADDRGRVTDEMVVRAAVALWDEDERRAVAEEAANRGPRARYKAIAWENASDEWDKPEFLWLARTVLTAALEDKR